MKGVERVIRAVLFDFDGTLANTFPLIYRSFRELWKGVDGRERTNEEIFSLFGPPEEEIIRREVPEQRLEAFLEEYFSLYQKFHEEEVEQVPQVLQLLRDLKAKGYHVGVVTGKGRKSAEISLAKLEMADWIDTLVTGSDVRRYKPDPEGIQKALSQLGCSPEEGIYIGDSPDDVRAGLAAGVGTVGVRWFPESDPRPFDPIPHQVAESVESFREAFFSQ